VFLLLITFCLNFFKRGFLNVIILFVFFVLWFSCLLLFGFLDRAYSGYQYISVLSLSNFNAHFFFIGFALDGLSLSFILLTVIIFILCILTTFDYKVLYIKEYCNLIVAIFCFLIFSFLVTDVFSFFFLFESIILPMFLLIGI